MATNYITFIILITSHLILCQKVNNGRPNILLIVADDYGWNDIGYHGSEIHTPTLDTLAAKGVKLNNYYVQPICSPTRSQLLSGRYQIHTGLQHFVIEGPQPNALPSDIPTLADELRALGYATHMVGKWHLGFYKEEFLPTKRGFDSFFGYLTGNEDYFRHYRCWANTTWCGLDLDHGEKPVYNQNGTYSAQMFSQRVQELVATHARYNGDQPLFMYLPLQSVHSPLQAPEHYMKPYQHIKDVKRRTYAGMVAAMDETVRNVTHAFRQCQLWDNTIMIFSTDNGGPTSVGANNWPLRGGKAQLWEGGLRGVGFVTGPVLQRQDVVSKELIHVSDWFPTLVHLAGGNTSRLALDGFDVWKTINEGKGSPRKEILHNIDPLEVKIGRRWSNTTFDNRARAAIRVGDWKLLTGSVGAGRWVPPPHLMYEESPSNTAPDDPPYDPYNTTPEEEDLDPKRQNVWLFNVKDDPNEKHDLSAIYPDRVHSMLERLAEYNATAVPCRFPPLDPNSDPKLHGGVWGPWIQ